MSGEDDADRNAVGAHFGRAKTWVLLSGPRGIIALVTAFLLFAVLAAVSLSPLTALNDTQPLFYVYSSLIGGNLTIITVVVSINQLLLSRELMSPDELEAQIEGVIEYRREVERSADRIAPVEPLGFLRLLLENTRRTAQRLGGLSSTETDEAVAGEIRDVVSAITGKVDRVDGLLRTGDPSMFQVLSTTLTTNYAREINQLRRIHHGTGNQLPGRVDDQLDELVENLQNIDIARQYFKTIYLQQELSLLSMRLFYTGLPAVAVVAATLFLFTGPNGAGLPDSVLSVFVPAVVTVGFLPLILLFSYIVRMTTVTYRTVAILPFTAPAQER